MARNKLNQERSTVWDFMIFISITSTFLMRLGQEGLCVQLHFNPHRDTWAKHNPPAVSL